MNTKKNVRDRRSEKIRKLQQNAWRSGYGEPDITHFDFPIREERQRGDLERRDRLEPMPYNYNNRPVMREEDPEVEWRRKYQREWSMYEDHHDSWNGGGPKQPVGQRFALKVFVSGLLFAMVWGMFTIDHPWTQKGRAVVVDALTKPFDTAAAAAWYERSFGGAPAILPAIRPSGQQDAEKVAALPKHYFTPVQGKLIAAFTPNQGGVLVEAAAGAPISAVDQGMVTFAGEKDDTGYTVILRHTGGVESVYGHLTKGKLQAGDWIKGGETFGTLAKPATGATGTLFFAVSKEGRPVNPTDVIPFD